ncbi:MAG TPA: alpha/beta hydrolase [Ramlibacter sp.]|jgi:alpha/beta superfamily hydrolase|nr:alpha/beta hydrolase [Ramlibacter sp.]
MNSQTRRFEVPGPVGSIEVLRDEPAAGAAPHGVAVLAHPHPLFGGTMDNKVVQTLARAFVQSGWSAVRFNFRGVGATQGTHDGGRGELEDMLALIADQAGEGALAIAGFSFGAYVASGAVQALWPSGRIGKIVLVGTSAQKHQLAPLPVEAHDRTLVIHGEQDDTVPLTAVLDWARPQSLPVTVVPGVAHFFHGQLPLLKNLVVRHLRS